MLCGGKAAARRESSEGLSCGGGGREACRHFRVSVREQQKWHNVVVCADD